MLKKFFGVLFVIVILAASTLMLISPSSNGGYPIVRVITSAEHVSVTTENMEVFQLEELLYTSARRRAFPWAFP